MTLRAKGRLAVLGGTPAFDDVLHVGRPNVGNRERLFTRFNEVFDRCWLTNHGPMVEELETRLADHLGVRHVILTANGTVALEILLVAAGVSGEVIVPAFTFVATAHAVRWLGLRPVFADIDRSTHNLDPREVEKSIGPQTTAILGVHLWGRPCAPEALEEIAARHGLILLFDASHGIGVTHHGRPIGTFGMAEAFSFHATKVFNTLEGGAIATDDNALAARVRQIKNFGFAGMDWVVGLGTNGKMNELCAAMGLTSLEDLPRFIAANQRNHRAYAEGLAGLAGIDLVQFEDDEKQNYQYAVVEVDEARAGIGRDELLQVLHAENVRARRYFWPGCHSMEPYRSDPFYDSLRLPETDAVAERVLCLPTGSAIQPDDARRIAEILAKALEHAEEIRGLVPRRLPPGNTATTLPPR